MLRRVVCNKLWTAEASEERNPDTQASQERKPLPTTFPDIKPTPPSKLKLIIPFRPSLEHIVHSLKTITKHHFCFGVWTDYLQTKSPPCTPQTISVILVRSKDTHHFIKLSFLVSGILVFTTVGFYPNLVSLTHAFKTNHIKRRSKKMHTNYRPNRLPKRSSMIKT